MDIFEVFLFFVFWEGGGVWPHRMACAISPTGELNPHLPAVEVLTTRPPGKPRALFFGFVWGFF